MSRIHLMIGFLILLLAAQLLYFWPTAGEQGLLRENALHYMNKRVTRYLYQQYDIKNNAMLLISDRPNLYVIHGIGSVGFQYALEKQRKLHVLENIYYDHILVLQKCNPSTHEVLPGNHLNDGFLLSEVKRIKKLIELGVPLSKISKEYKVYWATINDIKHNITWKHVK